jgi:hypothetical protein
MSASSETTSLIKSLFIAEGLGCLTPISTISKLYRGSQFYWWDEARADLARLAIIRKQREEAAKKRDAEKGQILYK